MTEFRVTYSYGRGSFVMDLDEILPASASNMKRIRSVIDMDENPVEKAQELHEYIVSRVEELKRQRDIMAAGPEQKADFTAKIKTFVSDNDSLVKEYGVEKISDTEVVKSKKHDVYAHIWTSKTGKSSIEVYTGKIFTKYGRTYTAYKDASGFWAIILPENGLSVTQGKYKSFNKAVAWLDESIDKCITNVINSEKYPESVKCFRDCMIDAGYGDMLTADEFQMENTVENESPVEEAPVVADTAEIPAPTEDTAPVENVTSADDIADMVENPARVAKVHTHKPWRDGRKSRRCRMVPRRTVRRVRRAFRSEEYWNTS